MRWSPPPPSQSSMLELHPSPQTVSQSKSVNKSSKRSGTACSLQSSLGSCNSAHKNTTGFLLVTNVEKSTNIWDKSLVYILTLLPMTVSRFVELYATVANLIIFQHMLVKQVTNYLLDCILENINPEQRLQFFWSIRLTLLSTHLFW
jgi:hypothetical protein